MSKIIKLNEGDLKRIVKKVLNERKQLNEIFLWIAGAAALAGVGQEVYNWWASGDARERAGSVFQNKAEPGRQTAGSRRERPRLERAAGRAGRRRSHGHDRL